ncbi:hypothetical protein [Kaistella jeonii]
MYVLILNIEGRTKTVRFMKN